MPDARPRGRISRVLLRVETSGLALAVWLGRSLVPAWRQPTIAASHGDHAG